MSSGANVVAATDFSVGAAAALAAARRLVAQVGGTVSVVHVQEGFGGRPWEVEDATAAWLAGAEVAVADLVVRRGFPWVELVRHAAEVGATLVFAGTHGSSGFQPVALGGTAARLALLSPCPVVLVGDRVGGGWRNAGEVALPR